MPLTKLNKSNKNYLFKEQILKLNLIELSGKLHNEYIFCILDTESNKDILNENLFKKLKIPCNNTSSNK